MTPLELRVESEWGGIKGRIGALYLNSHLRRISEVLIFGDLRTSFLNRVDAFLKGNGMKGVVLDVGAGSGYFSIPIAERIQEGTVICVDLSSVMLQELERKAVKKGLPSKIEAKLGNVYQLEIDDSSVDLAISNGVFHELSLPRKALGEIERVLKPAGHVIISDFRDTALGKRIGAAHHQEDHGPYSLEELKGLLNSAGFANVEVEAVRHWVLASGQKQ